MRSFEIELVLHGELKVITVCAGSFSDAYDKLDDDYRYDYATVLSIRLVPAKEEYATR